MNEVPHIFVCGGRDFDDTFALASALKAAARGHDKVVVVHGACPTGADKIADQWAFDEGQVAKRFHADWDAHGKAAGPIRNAEMLTYLKTANLVAAIVCWDGKSKGTADMVRRLDEAKISYRLISYKGK